MNRSLALVGLLSLLAFDGHNAAPTHSFAWYEGGRGQFWRRYTGRANRRR